MPDRTVFFVSDGTGITAETFGNSILAQFAEQAAPCAAALHRHVEKAYQVVREINLSRAARGQARPSCSSRW
jgi:regulator of PEP synthase PpsR (kinase-PPPase family)